MIRPIYREDLLAEYLAQLIDDKGKEELNLKGDNVQLLICMYVCEDLYNMIKKSRAKKEVDDD